jgi:hypothetical protein
VAAPLEGKASPAENPFALHDEIVIRSKRAVSLAWPIRFV